MPSLTIINRVGKFKGQCGVRVWLCQIGKNTYFTYLRKEGYTVPFKSELADDSVSLENQMIDREVVERIRQIMAEMDEPYGGVLLNAQKCKKGT